MVFFLRAGRTNQGGDSLAMRPYEDFVTTSQHRLRLVAHVRPGRMLSDGQAPFRFTRGTAHLAAFVIEPVLTVAGNEAGVIHPEAVEQIRITGGAEDRIASELLPWPVR